MLHYELLLLLLLLLLLPRPTRWWKQGVAAVNTLGGLFRPTSWCQQACRLAEGSQAARGCGWPLCSSSSNSSSSSSGGGKSAPHQGQGSRPLVVCGQ
jgi:hypothetical protein